MDTGFKLLKGGTAEYVGRFVPLLVFVSSQPKDAPRNCGMFVANIMFSRQIQRGLLDTVGRGK